MPRLDATDQLALLATAGELVVAIRANEVFQIRRAVETRTRKLESNLFAVDLEDITLPGWDLGELFKLGTCTDAWIIVEPMAGRKLKRFCLRVGKCIAVHRLPKCHSMPRGVFTSRSSAIASAFATREIAEVQSWPSGGVLDLDALLASAEIEAGLKVVARREGLA